MKTFRIFKFAVLVLSLGSTVGYSFFGIGETPSHSPYPGPVQLEEIYAEHNQLMYHRHGLLLGTVGVAQEQEKLSRVEVSYFSDRTVSVDEAREIWAATASSLLELINSNESIADQLAYRPMGLSNVDVHIRFATSRGNLAFNPDDHSVVSVIQAGESILFTTYDQELQLLEALHEERCEQALANVGEPRAHLRGIFNDDTIMHNRDQVAIERTALLYNRSFGFGKSL